MQRDTKSAEKFAFCFPVHFNASRSQWVKIDMTTPAHHSDGPSSTIYSIQYLRAFAAILVLFWHLKYKSAQFGTDLLSGYAFGFAGVDVFFVISGFVMCFIYTRSKAGRGSLGAFWSRRFARIMPLYWLLTCVALVVYLIDPSKVNSSGGTTSIWKSFVLVPGQDKFLIENGWTLSYEMYFYALFSLAFLFVDKTRGAFAVCALIAVLVSTNLLHVVSLPFLTSPLLFEFAFGIVIFLILSHGSGAWTRRLGVISLLAGLVGLASVHITSTVVPNSVALTVGLPAALIVFGVVSQESLISRAPSLLLARLGDSSYSMYLFHPFILSVAAIVFRKLRLGGYGIVPELAYWLLVAVSVLVASYWLFRFIETPLNRIVRSMGLKIWRRRREPTTLPTT
jgi:exopolysaccharide production protein ExoZ